MLACPESSQNALKPKHEVGACVTLPDLLARYHSTNFRMKRYFVSSSHMTYLVISPILISYTTVFTIQSFNASANMEATSTHIAVNSLHSITINTDWLIGPLTGLKQPFGICH